VRTVSTQTVGGRRRGATGSAADTRSKILDAAREVFATRGFDGARMRAIAARARVNLALIHYHFGGKELLYEAVIEDAFAEMARSTDRIALGASDPYAAVTGFVELITDYFVHHEKVQAIISREAADGGRRMRGVIERSLKVPFQVAATFYDEAAQKGLVAPLDGRHWVVSVFGMIAWYFQSAKVIEMLWPEDLSAPAVVARRKLEMTRLVLDGVRPRAQS
jgi:AcrR family transcriptional regulator